MNFRALDLQDRYLYFKIELICFLDVKELVQECVGGAELQQQKSKIQTFTEQTSSSLKRHVYANYMQFIETAKEISRETLKILNEQHEILLYFSHWFVS